MAPFLPIVALSRSQNVRIGRSPNAVSVPDFGQFNSTAPGKDAQTGALNVPAYVDLGDPIHRRDLQRHSSVGGVIGIGPISQTVTSDLLISGSQPTAVTVTNQLKATLGAFTLKSRTYGATMAVAGKTVSFAANAVANPRNDLVVADNFGNLSVVQGTAAASPVDPPVPANKTVVARVVIPASATLTTTATSATAIVPTT